MSGESIEVLMGLAFFLGLVAGWLFDLWNGHVRSLRRWFELEILYGARSRVTLRGPDGVFVQRELGVAKTKELITSLTKAIRE